MHVMIIYECTEAKQTILYPASQYRVDVGRTWGENPKKYVDIGMWRKSLLGTKQIMVVVKVHCDGTVVMNVDLLYHTWPKSDGLLAHPCRTYRVYT